MGLTTDAETGKGVQTEKRLDRPTAARNAAFVSKRKPPLEVVRVVRARAVDEAARSLREAADRAAAARAAAETARTAEESTRDRARRAAAEEQRNLGRAAGDLAQLAAFEAGNALAIDRAARDARAAERTSSQASSDEAAHRASLLDARTSLDIVEKHQEKARERRSREDDARIDEVAEDAFAARFGRKL